jgi:hypothetical protein
VVGTGGRRRLGVPSNGPVMRHVAFLRGIDLGGRRATGTQPFPEEVVAVSQSSRVLAAIERVLGRGTTRNTVVRLHRRLLSGRAV